MWSWAVCIAICCVCNFIVRGVRAHTRAYVVLLVRQSAHKPAMHGSTSSPQARVISCQLSSFGTQQCVVGCRSVCFWRVAQFYRTAAKTWKHGYNGYSRGLCTFFYTLKLWFLVSKWLLSLNWCGECFSCMRRFRIVYRNQEQVVFVGVRLCSGWRGRLVLEGRSSRRCDIIHLFVPLQQCKVQVIVCSQSLFVWFDWSPPWLHCNHWQWMQWGLKTTGGQTFGQVVLWLLNFGLVSAGQPLEAREERTRFFYWERERKKGKKKNAGSVNTTGMD